MFYTMFSGGDPTSLIEVGVEKAVGQIKLASDNSFGVDAGTYTVYQKIIDYGTLPNNTQGPLIPFEEYKGVLSLVGSCTNAAHNVFYDIPYASSGGYISIYTNNERNLGVTTTGNWSGYKALITATYFR